MCPITYKNTFQWLEHANIYDCSQEENHSYAWAPAEQSGLGSHPVNAAVDIRHLFHIQNNFS